MVRALIPLLIVVSIPLGACSSPASETETLPDSGPEEVVGDWFAALDAGDLDTIEAVTTPANVALIAGAENGFTVDQMTSVLDEGLPRGTSRSYWTSFRDSMAAYLGGDLTNVVVEDSEHFVVGTTSFAAVTIERDDARTEVLAQLDEDGWHVDLVATVGPALAVQIRRLVGMLVDEADEQTAHAYALEAAGSLAASLARDPTDRALELEVEAIGDLPIDLEG